MSAVTRFRTKYNVTGGLISDCKTCKIWHICKPCQALGIGMRNLNTIRNVPLIGRATSPPLAVLYHRMDGTVLAGFICSVDKLLKICPVKDHLLWDDEFGIYVMRTLTAQVRCSYTVAALLLRATGRKFVIADQLGRDYLVRFLTGLNAWELLNEVMEIPREDHLTKIDDDRSVALYNKFPADFDLWKETVDEIHTLLAVNDAAIAKLESVKK